MITYHRSAVPLRMYYTIGDTTIQRVRLSHKGFGCITRHHSEIIDRANRQLGFVMRTTKNFTNVHCLKALYTSLVRSILESSSVVWCQYQANWIDRIERIQKLFVRYALRWLPWRDRSNLPPYADRCCLLGLETLEQRRITHKALTAAKVLNGEIDCPNLLAKLALNAPNRIQRRSLERMLAPQFHRSLFGYNEPLSSVVRAFNDVAYLFDFGMSSKNFFRFDGT